MIRSSSFEKIMAVLKNGVKLIFKKCKIDVYSEICFLGFLDFYDLSKKRMGM